jgi:hypothetical protein
MKSSVKVAVAVAMAMDVTDAVSTPYDDVVCDDIDGF